MLDLLLNMLNWFENLKRAQDPLEAQYKGYQRMMLQSGLCIFILFLCGWFATPSTEGAGTNSALFNSIAETISTGVTVLALIAFAVFAWNLIAFFWFCRKHSIGE